MKPTTGRKTPTRSTSSKAPIARNLEGMSGAAVQFAASRANDLADALYGRAKDSIDWAQRSVTHVNLETVWQRAQPLLVRAGMFARDYPVRSGLIVVLLAGATLLVRTAAAHGDRR